MATGTKITLSDKELQLVCNRDWILTKHAVIQKVYDLFGRLQPQLQNSLLQYKEKLPAAMFEQPAKISKGENYQLLPYVMLDYPRYFGKEDTIAIRTFFWWGNFFSISLQLSGRFKNELMPSVENNFELLQQGQYWICVSDQPWDHHFEADNFCLIAGMERHTFSATLLRKPFAKIAKKMPLEEWRQVPEFLETSFEELVKMINPV